MFISRLLVSIFELFLMIFLSGVLITLIYRVFLRANPDFDMEDEIGKGNVAVGTLVAAIMISTALMLQKGLVASVGNFRLAISAPDEFAAPIWQAILLVLGHLTLTLAVAVLTISITLRLFGKMTHRLNPAMSLGVLLKNGNLAVGILLSAVVFIAALYVGEGVSALTKVLVPQPKVGTIRIMQ